MQKEIFKDVPDYDGFYQVSNLGRVKTLRLGKERILKGYINDGYRHIHLSINGNQKAIKVSVLIAITFLNHIPCGNTIVVDHINNNRSDDRLINLQLITHRNNSTKNIVRGSSKHIGVCWDKYANKWKAQIYFNKKRKHLGLYNTEIEAHYAYESKRLSLGLN